MISLIFKILADASPFRSVLKGLPNVGAQAGSMIGQQFKAGIMRYIGAGAVLGGISSLASEASSIVKDAMSKDMGIEEFQVLTKAAEMANMTLEELLKTARDAPQDFKVLTDAARESGTVMSEDSVRKLSNLKDRAESTKGFFADLASYAVTQTEKAFYGAFSGVGKAYDSLAKAYGAPSLTPRAPSWMTQFGEAGAETLTRLENPSLYANPVGDASRSLSQIQQGNAWWESAGGNTDWSAQSRTVKAKEDLKELEQLAKDQLEAAKEQTRQLKDLNETMRM